jgi:pimeloyl-ACP methyl ester carboxylesterase
VSNSHSSDALDFWEYELGRVNNTDLNTEFGANFTLTLHGDPYTTREVQYESPNWVDAFPSTLRIRGYLIYPQVVLAKNPAVLFLHGLGQSANESFGMAPYYLQKGFIVLGISYPGHGESEGPQPDQASFFAEGPINTTAHYYLTLCSAIQALRLLENLTIVDNSSIIVTGSSYGGFNTMWLSSIAGERIAGAIPMIAWGDFRRQVIDPTRLIYFVWGIKPDEIPELYWETFNIYFDPIYYLISPKLPPILWEVGTSDIFFHYSGINGTYEAANNTNKWLHIQPNGNHDYRGHEDTTEYFIDYIINGGSSPPNISFTPSEKEFGLLGDTLSIQVMIQSAVTPSKVKVCYRYLDILGVIWETMDLTRYDDGYWRGTLNPGIISSNIDYYIIVELEGSENVWFSSIIYTGGMFVSNFTIPFYIILVATIGIPVALLIRNRYRNDIKRLEEQDQSNAKKYLITEFILLGITETVFYISLILPWAVFEGGTVEWTHVYIFNDLYPYTTGMFLGVYTSLLTYAFIIGWIVYSMLSIMKPMLSGFIKIGYPLFVILVIGILTAAIVPGNVWSNYGSGYTGIGPILMLLSALSLFLIGFWKRKYQTKLGIRQAKRKHWFNVDRLLRIKNPTAPSKTTQKSEEIKES